MEVFSGGPCRNNGWNIQWESLSYLGKWLTLRYFHFVALFPSWSPYSNIPESWISTWSNYSQGKMTCSLEHWGQKSAQCSQNMIERSTSIFHLAGWHHCHRSLCHFPFHNVPRSLPPNRCSSCNQLHIWGRSQQDNCWSNLIHQPSCCHQDSCCHRSIQ